MTSNARYEQLKEKLRDISGLESALSLFHWDQQTYMPKLAAAGRASQVATLAAIQHEKRNAPELRDLVVDLLGANDLSPEQRANVKLVKRELGRAWAVPNDLIRAVAEQSARTHDVWLRAREQRSFSVVRSELERLVLLKQSYADALLSAAGGEFLDDKPFESRYDALLNTYESGARSRSVRALFNQLSGELRVLVDRIRGAESPIYPEQLVTGPFPRQAQEKFIRSLVARLGFDFNSGRMDETVHPFCSTIGLGDVRLCTRYDEANLFSGLFGAIHEAGHGVYELGLPAAQWGLPLGEACSLGIHESQSLLWEKVIARSRWFWDIHYPELYSHFEAVLSSVNVDDFFHFINRVRPTLIRINADEVTYSLHVILRFELEEAFINGALLVEDLPEAWREGYQKNLGITPPDDTEGVLQDTHWYSGLIGYFPTYSLGAMAAAQLFETFRVECGTTALESGDYSSLLDWLRDRVHVHGKRYDSADLIERVTEQPLSADCLVRYLNEKYKQIYKL